MTTPNQSLLTDADQSLMTTHDTAVAHAVEQKVTASGSTGAFPAHKSVQVPEDAYGPVQEITVGNSKIKVVDIGEAVVQLAAAPYLMGLLAEVSNNPNIGHVTVVSSLRTSQQQKALHDAFTERRKLQHELGDAAGDLEYKRKYNTLQLPHKAAPPGFSKHEKGLAIDIQVNGHIRRSGVGYKVESFHEMDLVAAIAQKYNWVRTLWPPRLGLSYPEPWHFEYAGPDHGDVLHLPTAAAKTLLQLVDAAQRAESHQKARVIKDFYSEVFINNSRARIASVGSKDHFDAYSLQQEALMNRLRLERATQSRRLTAASLPPVPIQNTPGVNTQVWYDFTTGLWDDGKPGGIR